MSDRPGHEPLKVESLTATVSPAPSEATRAPEAAGRRAAGQKVTITLHGGGFIQRAVPLIVKIGDQVVFGKYQVTADQRHLTFELDELPEDGAPIFVGYGGDDLMELPIRFSHEALGLGGSEPEV